METMTTTKKKKKEDKSQGLIDLVFSWSIADVLNQNLYKAKVNRIPETFSSADHYFKSFIDPLLEETHADLRSKTTTISHAPACEVLDVKIYKDSEPPKKLYYKLFLKPGKYEPENGDLIALTEVRPKRVDDLDRPKRPYHIVLVQGMKNEGSLKISILSSKPIFFQKADKEKGVERDKLFAVYLTNLTTNLRIWTSLHPDMDAGSVKIINSVLRNSPSVEDNCSVCSTHPISNTTMSKSIEALNSLGLDDSQRTAVLNCIAAARCRHQDSVKLIWGPPGTGKTKTVAALLFSILGIKCRTLTCAPTNVAVLGVTKRLMSLLIGKLPFGSYGLGDIVLFGNGERLKIDDHEDLYDVFLNHRVFVLSQCFAPLTGWNSSLESTICLLKDPEDQYLRYLGRLREGIKEDRDSDGEIEENSGGRNEDELNEIEKGKSRKKSWREIIIRDLKEGKKKNAKIKKASRERSQSKSNEKENKKSENPVIPWTFSEFVTKTFSRVSQRLTLCMIGLYTHMPTSILTLEVVKNMVRASDMLQRLQNLLNSIDASDKELKLALKGNKWIRNTINLNGMRLECLEVLELLRGTFSVPNFFLDYQIQSFCLKNACLIFCTASSSSKLHTEGMKPIELVIIDEAGQLKECESTIPLQLSGIHHAILVGDEKQLPAMVQSEICQKADFGRSLFERLVILGHSKHLLNVQYRMHPFISLFPNREFYDKRIKNGKNVLEKSYKRCFLKDKMFGSYSFINVTNGKEELDDRHSWRNMVEVAVVAEILAKLYEECTRSKQKVRVGCISAYKAQVTIQERLGNKYSTDADDKFSVNVRSVDGFQGGEEDLIIISTVRCNGNGSVGFLSNKQRVNVALTRARYCLWILGNASTLLNSRKVWKKLVLDAKSRGCFHDANENKNLSLAISNSLVELGHLNSLFSVDSVLFITSKWKIWFSTEFQESMKKPNNSGIHDSVVSLLVKLSNGWRQPLKDDSLGNKEGPSSQLLESYEVKGPLRLIWTIDIVREDSNEIQVIKVWDILHRVEIPKLVKKLDYVIGNYTVNHMSRCLSKRIEGNVTLPKKWPVNANAESGHSSKDVNHELASQLEAISLGDEIRPSSSSSRRSRGGNTNKQLWMRKQF